MPAKEKHSMKKVSWAIRELPVGEKTGHRLSVPQESFWTSTQNIFNKSLDGKYGWNSTLNNLKIWTSLLISYLSEIPQMGCFPYKPLY